MNRFTVGQTHTHRDIMDDKEKIEEALRLTKASMTYTKDERAHGLPTVHTLLVFLEEIKKTLEK